MTMFVDLGVLSLAIPKLLALDVCYVVLLFVLPFAPFILPGEGGVGVWVLSCFRLLRTFVSSLSVPSSQKELLPHGGVGVTRG